MHPLIVFAFTLSIVGLAFFGEAAMAQAAPARLVCETITAPKVDKKILPASCDKVCADKELTCVWNTAPINPNGCDAPAYQACRCCGIEEIK